MNVRDFCQISVGIQRLGSTFEAGTDINDNCEDKYILGFNAVYFCRCTLMIGADFSAETSVYLYQTARRHITEDEYL
jgi:hypothetical protein